MIAIRGAITVKEDSLEDIKEATVHLMRSLIEKNKLEEEDIISILFSVTKDLHSSYPGKHLREELNFTQVAMLHFQEMDVVDSLPKCIRVLLHCHGNYSPQHQYLGGAEKLRPDWKK